MKSSNIDLYVCVVNIPPNTTTAAAAATTTTTTTTTKKSNMLRSKHAFVEGLAIYAHIYI